MRRLFVWLLGVAALVMGVLVHLSDKDERRRTLQIGLNEMSWIPMGGGILAVGLGLLFKPRAWVGAIVGGIGALLAAKPFIQYADAADDMARAMQAGFGKNYETQIPPKVWARTADSIWSARNSLGRRERTAQARLTRNMPYAEVNGRALTLDVYKPLVTPALGDQYPALIVIHGGGWRHGEPGGWFAAHNRYYASQGYVVFDINYRLSGEAKWPAPFEDVLAAIRWVKEHADEYRVNPEQIALMGRSAGAHLALMAAYNGSDDTRVKAVVSIYAPTELRWPNLKADSAIVELMGGYYPALSQLYDSATPLTFVRDGLPPTLIVDAGMDTITPRHHADALANALALTDTPFAVLRSPWSRHGFDAVLSGLGGQLVQYHLDRFLAWSLYRGHASSMPAVSTENRVQQSGV
jgi:acetyl esterase/lipase